MAAPAVGKQVLDTGWLAARSTEVELTGVQLTTTDPPAAGPDTVAPWMPAAVPGTYVIFSVLPACSPHIRILPPLLVTRIRG